MLITITVIIVLQSSDSRDSQETSNPVQNQEVESEPLAINSDFSESRAEFIQENYEKSLSISLMTAEDKEVNNETRVRAYNECILSAKQLDDSKTAEECYAKGLELSRELSSDQAVQNWKIILGNSLNGTEVPLIELPDEG